MIWDKYEWVWAKNWVVGEVKGSVAVGDIFWI